jgi:Phosphotransferase enzyme family
MARLEDLPLDDAAAGPPELLRLLSELIGGVNATSRPTRTERLDTHVYRLRFEVDGVTRSLVAKRLLSEIAKRNRLVATRWLPAVGLGRRSPCLLGTASEPRAGYVWQVYEDLGNSSLDRAHTDRVRVRASVRAIADLHLRFRGHALLGECRLWGGDLGAHFFRSAVRDALSALQPLRPPAVVLASEDEALRDRLLQRLDALLEEMEPRFRALEELGGPETLLHGDLWTKNVFVVPRGEELETRLIDWDHAGVGPVSYDLSTLLCRFPREDRRWILNVYEEAMAPLGSRLPAASDLNFLFDTAERGRIANRVIWLALAVRDGDVRRGFDGLAEVDRWFETLEPVLP